MRRVRVACHMALVLLDMHDISSNGSVLSLMHTDGSMRRIGTDGQHKLAAVCWKKPSSSRSISTEKGL